jgi:hypothetical protein
LRSWEASQCFRSHGGVGISDEDCQSLDRQLKKELENKKPQIPKNEKKIDKTNKKKGE